MRSEVVRMMLLYCVGAHFQDVLLLDRRFYLEKGQVSLVSVKNERSTIEWEAK